MNMVKEFWENCSSMYAHLKYEIKKDSKIERQYQENVFSKINFKNKIVIDYGCSAAYLGLYLYTYHNIKKYIGIDIADRGLNKARAILKGTNAELYNEGIDFTKLKADIFYSMSTIHHFPDMDYFNNFLNMLNNSNFKTLFLQIRYNDTTECNDGYLTDHVGSACLTNEEYVTEKLSNYKLLSSVGEKIKYRAIYLVYEL